MKNELCQFVEIESIENIDEISDVYDIEVEEIHNFFANNILVHNCLGGIPAWCTFHEENFDEYLDPLMELFGQDRFFLELQFNKYPEQSIVNSRIIEYAKQTGYKLIATADAHYPEREMWRDRKIYQLLGYQLQKKGFDLSEIDKPTEEIEAELYLKNGDQIFQSYQETFKEGKQDERLIVDAIERTYDIAHHLIDNVSPDNSIKLPKTFQVTAEIKTPFDKLKNLTLEGLKQKGLTKKEYIDRAALELNAIKKLGVEEYFLAKRKILDVLRKHMLLGPARGCFLPDTKVLLNNGMLKKISCIEKNDKVLDAYGKPQKVLRKFEYCIEEDIICLKFDNKKEIYCTKDHKFLTKNGNWIKAVDLSEDDEIQEIFLPSLDSDV